MIRTDLAFMDPVTVTCEHCGGTRFNDEALSHRLRGRTIADVLAMTIAEAVGSPGGSRRAPGPTSSTSPPTALHMADVATLLGVFDRLLDDGGTVIAVEHDLDVIGHADWIIDIGPEAGAHGGRIVFEGTPEELLEDPDSHTAEFVRRDLAG